MVELIVLAVVGVTLFAILLVLISLIALVVRGLFWLVLLPLKILFAVLLLPLLIVKVILGGLLFVIGGPLLAFASIVAAVALSAILAVPLAPVLLLLFVGWLITRPRRQALVR